MKKKNNDEGIENAKQALIEKIKMPLTEADFLLLEEAKKMAKKKCKRGLHHTCCLILGKSGRYYPGLQQTYHRAADIETCAEEMAKGNIQYAQDSAETVVTIHFMPIEHRADGGVTTIVPPCSGCATRLRHLALVQHSPVGVIVYHDDKPIKIPPEYSFLFSYPIGYNGDGTSKF